jgi:hypothetical protein
MQNSNLLDVSVNSVLDLTPRKVGKLGFRFVRGIWKLATNREVKQLRKELEALKAQQA